MRPERDRVRAALDALKVDAWIFERDAGADNLILQPSSKSATLLIHIAATLPGWHARP